MKESVAVVGNGSTAIGPKGQVYVNRHTVNFLIDLANNGKSILYVESHVKLDRNSNLQDKELKPVVAGTVDVGIRRPWTFFRFIRLLFSVDFVYFFYPGSFAKFGVLLCRAFSIPYGIYLRGERFNDSGVDFQNLSHASFVCCVLGLEFRLRNLNTPVITIRPMLDIHASDAYVREASSFVKQRWCILFVGRLEYSKGVVELLDAAQLLASRGIQFELILVGGGELYLPLFSRYGNHPGNNVRVVGVIDNKSDLYKLYEEADFFVLPTHHEGFPRVLYEAMMKSCVVITTFVGGIGHVMTDNVNCVKIPVGDPVAISEVIFSLSCDVDKMCRISQSGHSTALAIIESYPVHSTKFLDLVNEINS